MAEKGRTRTEWALIIAIVSGVIIGKLIKKFAFGLLIGIFISLLYVMMAGKKKPGA